jgi:response regulator RpfG family c-di-GMP phosphodiesterase
MQEAMLQIHAGRGKQFSPAVVDTFAAVAHRRPDEVMPPERPAPSAVAV